MLRCMFYDECQSFPMEQLRLPALVAGLKTFPLLLLEYFHNMEAGIWTIQEIKVEAARSFMTCIFPMATVANGQKFGGLKQHRFIPLQFCRLGVQNQFHWAKSKVSSRGLRGNSIPLTFPVSRGRPHSLAPGLIKSASSSSVVKSSLSSSYKDLTTT